MMLLAVPMLLACTDSGPADDDEVGDDEGQDAGEPGPSGPGCEENWTVIDGPPLTPAIELPEHRAVGGSASQGRVEFTATLPEQVAPSTPKPSDPPAFGGPPMAWDEFVATVAEPWGGGWIVEGDMFLTHAQLQAVYQDYAAGTSSLLNFNAGIDEVWSGPRAFTLTWCVGVVFPQSWAPFPEDAAEQQAERYDRIVRGIEGATREWERIANVNFIHLREFDTPDSIQSGACQPGEDGIFFRVRMAIGDECKPPCTGRTMFTPIVELTPNGQVREVILSVSSATVEDTMQITARHELGHILGFAHEHERFDLEQDGCKPKWDWRTLTPDDPFSVMGYDICEGIAANQPRLSAYDRVGAFYQYNWARRHALMMGGGSSIDDLAYDGSGRAGIAWHRPLDHEIELWTSIGPAGAPIEFDVAHRCTSGGPQPCSGSDAQNLRRRPTPLWASGKATDLDVLMLGPGDELGDELLRNDDGAFQPSAFAIDGYAVPIVGSFESALDDELILYRPGQGEDEFVVFEQDGSVTRGTVVAPEFSIPLAGRFRGFDDGGNDILWYQPHANVLETWMWDTQDGFGFERFGPSDADAFDLAEQAEYLPVLGDFNGDEMTDMFWYAPGTRTDWLWLSVSSDIIAFDRHAHQVAGEYRPFPGDFDGDGIHDILWYSVADELEGSVSAIWYFREDGSHDVATFTIHEDYSPIVADFDRDECSDILWYDPASADGSSPVWRCVPGQLDFACDPSLGHPSNGFPIGFGGGY